MGWHGDLQDERERFERRSFGVLTRDEVWAMLYLTGKLTDYDADPDGDAHSQAAYRLLKEAVARVAPELEAAKGSRRHSLLEERDALMARLATIDAELQSAWTPEWER